MTTVAITRAVSPSIGRCQLTHLARRPIDVARADAQHRAYEACLAGLGCQVRTLPAEPDLPDAVFVEDVAVVLDELAIITRPGAASRRGERASIEHALAPLRPIARVTAPATLDGGDVVVIGRTILVGCSSRTNAAGVRQLKALATPHGYTIRPIAVHDVLHLKSACTAIDERTLLVCRRRVEAAALVGFDLVDVAPGEPDGANVLRIGNTLVCAAAHPRTIDHLRERGHDAVPVDISELQKAESAVTCSSLIVHQLTRTAAG